jgi:hypothetical protein
VLGKDDGSVAFKRSATFYRVPGLADKTWSSFRVHGAPDKYLRQSDGTLRIQAAATASDKEDSTFRLIYEGADLPPA